MTGAFAAGRIVNTRTAHGQYMGGMIWGMASALLEATEVDPCLGRFTKSEFRASTSSRSTQMFRRLRSLWCLKKIAR